MSKFLRRFLYILAVAALMWPASSEAAVRIGSWNVKHLGWNEGKDYRALAEVIQYFDFVALQEVMSQQGIDALEAAIEARTSETWVASCSHLVGRGSDYKEMYCFLWRESAVTADGGEVVYLDDKDVFSREPYAARFKAADGSASFVAASMHSIYGNDVKRRQGEAKALRSYWDWLRETYGEGELILLMGDFNLPPSDGAWEPLKQVATPLITKGATTLSLNDGKYASLYDNIWVPNGVPIHIKASGILPYVRDILNTTNQVAYERVSDHAPVYAVIDPTAPARTFGAIAPINGKASGGEAKSAGDASAPFVGNRKSKIYHWPGCPGYDATYGTNREPFVTKAEAEAAGFRAARNCPAGG